MYVRPKKHLGQHFLKDDAISARIAAALTHHGGYRQVLEVGPGTGALTRHLVHREDIDLYCVELDDESIAHLSSQWPDLRLMHGDLLRMDLGTMAEGQMAVIGNFPYNISTQIIFKVIDHRDQVSEVVGMFQKEVADRLCAPPGSRTYGISSVLAQAWYDIEHLFIVEPDAFIPPPKVRSAVIRMQRNAVRELPCDAKAFTQVVKTAFNQRRKTLHNALKAYPAKGKVPEQYAGLRAERLSVADFVVLTNALTAQDPEATGSTA